MKKRDPFLGAIKRKYTVYMCCNFEGFPENNNALFGLAIYMTPWFLMLVDYWKTLDRSPLKDLTFSENICLVIFGYVLQQHPAEKVKVGTHWGWSPRPKVYHSFGNPGYEEWYWHSSNLVRNPRATLQVCSGWAISLLLTDQNDGDFRNDSANAWIS